VTYPAEPVLIARGKYATLGADKRALMKELHEHVSAITDQARLLLRHGDEKPELVQSFYDAMARRTDLTADTVAKLSEIHAEMEALRPEAWEKRSKAEELENE